MLPALKALLLHMVVVRHHSPADDGYLGRGTVNNRVSLLRRFVEVQPLSYEFFLFFLFFYFLFTLYIGFYFMDCVLSKGKGQLSNVKCVM